MYNRERLGTFLRASRCSRSRYGGSVYVRRCYLRVYSLSRRFFWFSALLGDVTSFREGLLALRGGNWGPGRGDRFVSWESSGFRRLFRVFGS